MNEFLSKLRDNNESYRSDNFRGLFNSLRVEDFIELVHKIKYYLDIKDPIERLSYLFSDDNLIKWIAYNNLFKNMDSLLERIKNRYQSKKLELTKQDKDIDSLLKDIKSILIEIKKDLNQLNGSDNNVS